MITKNNVLFMIS